jgi:Adenylate kinase and related kinases
MRYYIIFGPPGVGKGTQSKFIAEKFNLKHISTGDLLRKEIREGSELGRMAQEIIARGEFVNDETMFGILRKELISADRDSFTGFILDGFPRTLNQAITLDEMLTEIGNGKIDAVISLEAEDEVLTDRILKRAVMEGRQDDASPEVISERIKTYHIKTEPLISFYKKRDKYYPIVGTSPIEEVFEEICSTISTIRD